jgi:hypothetical protein
MVNKGAYGCDTCQVGGTYPNGKWCGAIVVTVPTEVDGCAFRDIVARDVIYLSLRLRSDCRHRRYHTLLVGTSRPLQITVTYVSANKGRLVGADFPNQIETSS